jgi:hypothetical protein
MVRTTVGTIAEAELSVQESESVVSIAASQTSTVSSSGSQTTSVTAPTGTIITVLALRCVVQPPSGATSGNHTITVAGPAGNVRYLLAGSSFDTKININDCIIVKANQTAQPSTDSGQVNAITSIRADDTQGVQFTYNNNTDASQAQERDIDIIALERGVTS